MAKDRIDELYEQQSFYEEYIRYIQAFETDQVKKTIQDITQEIVKTRLEQAIFAIVLQSVDNPDLIGSYVASFQIFTVGNRNQIYFSPATPLVGMTEYGVKPFSMKEKLLSTGSVKISKQGHPYKTVPISREMPGKNAKLDTLRSVQKRSIPVSNQQSVISSKEIQMQARVNAVLQNAKFSFVSKAKDAEGRTIQRSVARDLDVGTLIKEETFDVATKTAKPIKTKYVIFRTMSAKPGSADWMNPGFSGKDLYAKVLNWQSENEERIFEQTYNEIISKAIRGDES
jgi:hypothetical protein